MSEGMTRRELIKASAIAGTVAWTAPIILRGTAGAVVNTVCFAVKISSCANSTGNPGPGTVAQCDFTGAQLTVNFGTCINLECSTYAPVNGFFFSVRGPVATNLTRIALKWSGNAPATCSNDFGGAGCHIDNGPFPANDNAINLQPWSGCGGANPSDSGFALQLSAIDQTRLFTRADGTTFTPVLPPSGGRWVLIDTPAQLNEVGLEVCFSFGSVPPAC